MVRIRITEDMTTEDAEDDVVATLLSQMQPSDLCRRLYACDCVMQTNRGDVVHLHRRHYRKLCYLVHVPNRRSRPAVIEGRPSSSSHLLVHPDKLSLASRFHTFDKDWSRRCYIPAEILAMHGFVAIPDGKDTTQCIACGCLFYDWLPMDIPIREHVRLTKNSCSVACSLYERVKRQHIGTLFAQPKVSVLVPPPSYQRQGRKSSPPLRNWQNVYADIECRRESFRRHNWRDYTPYITSEILARCGFVAIGRIGWLHRARTMRPGRNSTKRRVDDDAKLGSDAVQCFSCNYVFYDWSLGDDVCVWTEHQAWTIADCAFLQKLTKL